MEGPWVGREVSLPSARTRPPTLPLSPRLSGGLRRQSASVRGSGGNLMDAYSPPAGTGAGCSVIRRSAARAGVRLRNPEQPMGRGGSAAGRRWG